LFEGHVGRPCGRTIANRAYWIRALQCLTKALPDGLGPFDWILRRRTLLAELGRVASHLWEECPQDRGAAVWVVRLLADDACQRRPKVAREVARLRALRLGGSLRDILRTQPPS
jgi:hypothetical protein